MIKVRKRNGNLVPFDIAKIEIAIQKAFLSCNVDVKDETIKEIASNVSVWDNIGIEDIQDQVEELLLDYDYLDVYKAFSTYRGKQSQARFIRERLDYMDNYANNTDNASSSSETDPNSNVSMKNVANLEGEVYKLENRTIQRQRMKKKLNDLYPNLGESYLKDLNSHLIYVHDEASTPVLKPYCMAVTLYPLMLEGVGNIDGVTPSAPNDIESFSGQITNLAFLLSSQCKGAVAFGSYFIALNYYVVKEFGEDWYNKLDLDSTSSNCLIHRTIKSSIEKGMKQFIWGVNQPAGNRSFNSPFTNVSWYDKYYFKSLFGEFYYPDGTKPEWKAIDTLQRMFMELMRQIRLIKPITFPVTTMALVHNGKEYLDKEYKELCAEEWAKGGSFFCYNSDNPTSLASCCRVLNEMSENVFSSTTGMTGVMTGSCNVITLNLNRIIQNCNLIYGLKRNGGWKENASFLKQYLVEILDRVFKYHIAYKTILYDLEDKRMLASSNGGYIYMSKLYSTIGVIGYYEAAKFLGFDTNNNSEYKDFLSYIFNIIKEEVKSHNIHDSKRPFLFNIEAIPGENLGVKLYEWDKKDAYEVPEDQNLYNCYFYNPWDTTSTLDKLKLHGKQVSIALSGGQACHINLDTHLSKEQYLKLMDVAMTEGCNYFTFNIPISECKECKHVVNAPIRECPKCGSKNITYYTRIIGYLTKVDNWSNPRQEEFKHRVYGETTIKGNN